MDPNDKSVYELLAASEAVLSSGGDVTDGLVVVGAREYDRLRRAVFLLTGFLHGVDATDDDDTSAHEEDE